MPGLQCATCRGPHAFQLTAVGLWGNRALSEYLYIFNQELQKEKPNQHLLLEMAFSPDTHYDFTLRLAHCNILITPERNYAHSRGLCYNRPTVPQRAWGQTFPAIASLMNNLASFGRA
jgi:hypothetical protein